MQTSCFNKNNNNPSFKGENCSSKKIKYILLNINLHWELNAFSSKYK